MCDLDVDTCATDLTERERIANSAAHFHGTCSHYPLKVFVSGTLFISVIYRLCRVKCAAFLFEFGISGIGFVYDRGIHSTGLN